MKRIIESEELSVTRFLSENGQKTKRIFFRNTKTELKLVRLHIGHLIRPDRAPWYDFCHMKNLEFPPSPINRMQFREGEKGAHRVNRGPKLVRLPATYCRGRGFAKSHGFKFFIEGSDM